MKVGDRVSFMLDVMIQDQRAETGLIVAELPRSSWWPRYRVLFPISGIFECNGPDLTPRSS